MDLRRHPPRRLTPLATVLQSSPSPSAPDAAPSPAGVTPAVAFFMGTAATVARVAPGDGSPLRGQGGLAFPQEVGLLFAALRAEAHGDRGHPFLDGPASAVGQRVAAPPPLMHTNTDIYTRATRVTFVLLVPAPFPLQACGDPHHPTPPYHTWLLFCV